MTEMNDLAARWRTPDGEKLAVEVVGALMRGRSLRELGLGEHDGRVDLRGLTLPPPKRLARYRYGRFFVERLGDVVALRERRLEGLDFSGAALSPLELRDVVVADCRFVEATCRGWRMWSTRVTDCDYTRADLRDSALGTGRRDASFNRWEQVSFRGADLRGLGISAADFDRCDFAAAKLVEVDFRQCVLRDCTFSGVLTRVNFDGRELPDQPAPPQPSLVDVDFGSVVFNDCRFSGCDLSHVRLPEDPDLLLIRRYPLVARRVLAEIAADTGEHARVLTAMLEMDSRGFRRDDADALLNLRDYRNSDADPFGDYVEAVLRRAAAAVNGNGPDPTTCS